MQFDLVSALLGLVVGVSSVIAVMMAQSGGNVGQGLRLGRRVKTDPEFARKLEALLNPPPPPPPAPVKPDGTPVRLLGILQREARLVDFLLEDIAPYSDDQIGSSVRDIHRKAQAALKESLTFEPVITGEEGASVTVATGFDPAAIRLLGNVAGKPPFQGTLQHHGWRVKVVKLPAPAEGQDEFVIHPAEVELPGA
ncbi:DUF2760 domain-containing protein [Tuwongella immobilis]|uniref:DUF2760 domain-containing protein n=1 Tax=Tuwongella immobilis TaxID=692036 RepID=A0A6C2YUP3_9BACT|nr:DUF2760 domain-containing protein [Tuwongella immobilis]VIP04635.1 Uncharacterized protein OS=Singulisphaera acidiphila (strain ATCC BAA-1392 / DSM 18658 / VKM B-2454 / MOB10) GN=Sinac_2983 PE=4 SV=1: DUF2760 [Tuwongella immobilis]VTS06631.1 Uncharacterized protein OS=Singulisphaera acidiphila (strain ATCC BAA-1392 / DSM 18658 / VKM B-2454 / MOB10) GN=Sinac_2983 PE=4 SV=1: DUF2760 [Tuwongella immobilis]